MLKGWRKITTKVTTALASIVVYLPVVAGIITPMVYLLPAWYVSWYVAAIVFPFSESWSGFILPINDIMLVPIIWIVGFVILIIGIGIFLWGLFEMTRQIRNGTKLVASGPYAFVRHPQHLGILILLLPFAFAFELRTGFSTGIRPGDILSWSLMGFLLLSVADFEESQLSKHLEGYAEYKSRTPFIIPLSLSIRFNLPQLLHQGRPVRYLLFFVIYWIIISLLLFGLIQLPMNFTR